MATLAPSSASATAVAAPIPDDAPVTSASFRTSRGRVHGRSVDRSFGRSASVRSDARYDLGQTGQPDNRTTERPADRADTPPYASQSVPRGDRRRGGRGLSWGRRWRTDRAAALALDGDGGDGAARVRRASSASWPRPRPEARSRCACFRAARWARSARSCSSSRKGSSTSWCRARRSGAASRPKLQVFDFPFLWRDWAHVHDILDGSVGRDAADYLDVDRTHAAVRVGRLVRLPSGHHTIARRQ